MFAFNILLSSFYFQSIPLHLKWCSRAGRVLHHSQVEWEFPILFEVHWYHGKSGRGKHSNPPLALLWHYSSRERTRHSLCHHLAGMKFFICHSNIIPVEMLNCLMAALQMWKLRFHSQSLLVSLESGHIFFCLVSVQFSSVTQSCPTLCNPMNRSTPGLPVHHHLPEFTQTHLHRVGDAIQPSHPGSSPSPAPNLSQHQSLFQWVSSSHEVFKVLELQL